MWRPSSQTRCTSPAPLRPRVRTSCRGLPRWSGSCEPRASTSRRSGSSGSSAATPTRFASFASPTGRRSPTASSRASTSPFASGVTRTASGWRRTSRARRPRFCRWATRAAPSRSWAPPRFRASTPWSASRITATTRALPRAWRPRWATAARCARRSAGRATAPRRPTSCATCAGSAAAASPTCCSTSTTCVSTPQPCAIGRRRCPPT